VPIEILKKEKFEKGLITHQDSRDLDESSLANATNVMCDLPGRVRQMGGEQTPAEEPTVLTGHLTPGYGLYAFNADFNISNTAIPAKLLAYQNSNDINIYDSTTDTEHTSELTLGTDSNIVRPRFYYTGKALRISDSNYDNDTNNQYVKWYGYIKKNYFTSLANVKVTHNGDWNQGSAGDGLDAYIYPPTQNGASTATLVSNANLATENIGAAGNISLAITGVDTGGEWVADGEDAYKFGLSFTYEGDTTFQESPITAFEHTFDATTLSDDFTLHLQIYVATGGSITSFDPRITGCKVWLMGDSTGDYDDPMYLANFFWGKDTDENTFLESHRGDKIDSTGIGELQFGGIWSAYNTSTLEIPTMPALTYSLLNPNQSHLVDSTAARFTTSTTINSRVYIGGIKRYAFNTGTVGAGQRATYKQPTLIKIDANFDRMLRSPVFKYDIFPGDNYLDIPNAINDGESITALESFADRVFQFKEKTLYIINVGGEKEFVEAEERYRGVSEQYQVVKTEYGVVWVNKNGCYIFTEKEGIINLIDGKLELNRQISNELQTVEVEGWQDFVGQNAMIGYIPDLKQIIVFQDPASPFENGNVMIYDFRTGSWTRGIDRVSSS